MLVYSMKTLKFKLFLLIIRLGRFEMTLSSVRRFCNLVKYLGWLFPEHQKFPPVECYRYTNILVNKAGKVVVKSIVLAESWTPETMSECQVHIRACVLHNICSDPFVHVWWQNQFLQTQLYTQLVRARLGVWAHIQAAVGSFNNYTSDCVFGSF